MKLAKAKLIEIDKEGENTGTKDNSIEFMFNPKELSFSRSMSIEQSKGARNKKGNNKTSFKHPNPYMLKISNIMLDTYETGENVLKYVSQFQKGVRFLEGKKGDKAERPPLYAFTWGEHRYIFCFIKNLDFKLSLFLPNGTPVRATVNLSLEQVNVNYTPKPLPDHKKQLKGLQRRMAEGRQLMF